MEGMMLFIAAQMVSFVIGWICGRLWSECVL